jgi:formate dehydrogenase major subunit
VAKGYSREEALAEAERCLDCGIPFGIRTCWFCLPCEIECPEEALYVEIPYLLR